jgi:hypothetical protein
MPLIAARGVTLVGLTVTNLVDTVDEQLALPLPEVGDESEGGG